MTTATTSGSVAREPRLLGQTVVVIGGSAGIGLETARLAHSEGADVVLTGRNPERLEQAARELSARNSAAFDAGCAAAVKRFLDDLPAPLNHVLVAAYTRGSYGPMLEMPSDEAAVEARREELRATSPIGRVVEPADVAALAVHLMINTAVTGATYDIDGGQRLIA